MSDDVARFEADGLREVDPAGRGVDLSIRLARQDDFAFIDALQKAESDKVGFMYEQAIRKRIEEGNVIVAEATKGVGCGVMGDRDKASSSAIPRTQNPTPIGYCLGVDRYQKRSELGIIYQMAVAPEFRRCNVAASLLQAQFDKSAYGTRLYCCWCKQSLAANRFWESMGFVPLAFRAGARPRNRKQAKEPVVHIFWQKRIRAGDVETAWWYPYETQGGAMMEGRVVLPLPPGVRWDQAVPVVLPVAERREAEQRRLAEKVEAIEQREREVKKRTPRRKAGAGKKAKSQKRGASRVVMGYGFGAASGFGVSAEEGAGQAASGGLVDEHALAEVRKEKAAAKQALRAAQRKNDPGLVAYARELRDRWQEHVAASPGMVGVGGGGRYRVERVLLEGRGQAGARGVEDVERVLIEGRGVGDAVRGEAA